MGRRKKMAREKFEKRTIKGKINVACKFDNNGTVTVRYWEGDKTDIIKKIIYIVDLYSKQGYILSLRQLHYQFVTRNWIVNHDTAYKKLGSILDDCRYAGLVDWDAIEDRGRTPFLPWWVNNPDEGLQAIINQYRINRQLDQQKYVELWTEKDALSGILRHSTSKYHIQLVVNKGYTSSSAAYNAYERISKYILKDKQAIILYFGDHDPSGLDMIRDIRDRLTLFLSKGQRLQSNSEFWDKIVSWWNFSGNDLYNLVEEGYASNKLYKMFDAEEPNNIDELYDEYESAKVAMYLEEKELFKVIQIGLTMDQIKEYDLPANPTKITDSRSDNYVIKFGKTCWEVDALEPSVLTSIVETHITEHIDLELYEKMIVQEKKDIEYLKKLLKK